MERRSLIKGLAAGIGAIWLSRLAYAESNFGGQEMAAGPFQPNWDSLTQYQVPEWFRDAKFGMWAHWGPQCQPEMGDWYGRKMYMEGTDQYKYHCEKYGHPSKFGFKDVINEWKAEKWDPEELVALYKNAGAKYFMAMANHHDNLDLFESKHQKWNSTKVGPKKDIIGGWAKAARNQGLPFGVSVHAAHAWRWYETAQRADKTGPMAGISYDGKLKKGDGLGKWWNGYDPQDLYAQNHPLSIGSEIDASINKQWDWGNGAALPTIAYCENFYKRTIGLINKYGPEVIYFDDTALPLWPVNDAGLRIAAYFYNDSIKRYGKLRSVITGKILNEQQRKCLVWDVERGNSNHIEAQPWQADTCIGGWHYDRRLYNNNKYKTAKTVIHTLADVVSKNGNLLLNIPVRGDGSIDEKERAIVAEVGAWISVNGEGIFSTRPWRIFGEGPAIATVAPLSDQGFNEGKGKPFTAHDIRFTVKGKTLYAIMLGWPEGQIAIIKNLGLNADTGKVHTINLLGYGVPLVFTQTEDDLKIRLPDTAPGKNAFVFKLEGAVI